MSAVGDWVVCVDASDDPRGVPTGLIKGEVYRISAVWGDLPNSRLGDLWRDVGFDLEGMPRLDGDFVYGAYRFRPLERAPEKQLETAGSHPKERDHD